MNEQQSNIFVQQIIQQREQALTQLASVQTEFIMIQIELQALKKQLEKPAEPAP